MLDESKMETADKLKAMVEEKLHYSDKVVNGDLLRFHSKDGSIKE